VPFVILKYLRGLGHRPPSPQRAVRTSVVITLEPHTAARLRVWHEAQPGEARLARWIDADDRPEVVLADDRSNARQVVLVRRRLLEWIEWAEARPDAVEIVYLRPGGLRLGDVWRDLPGVGGPRTSFDTRRILWLDKRLATRRVITLETLYFSPTKAAAELRDALAMTGTPDFGGLAAYHQAMGAVLRRVYAGAVDDLLGPADLALDRVYRTTSDQIGSVCLGRGWSTPESKFTWTDGASAILALPLSADAADPAKACLRLQLIGHVACQPFRAQLFVGSQRLGEVRSADTPGVHLSIDAPLPGALLCGSGGLLVLELFFDTTYRLADVNPGGDSRWLGLALTSILVHHHTYGPAIAELRASIGQRKARCVLSLGPIPEDLMRDLTFMLEDLGTSHVLVRHSDEPSAASSDLGSGDPSSKRGNSASGSSESPTHQGAPGNDLTLVPRPDLILLWTAERLGSLLQELARCSSGPVPDLAVYTHDPKLFNATWHSHRSPFEQIVFKANVTIGGAWIMFSLGRST